MSGKIEAVRKKLDDIAKDNRDFKVKVIPEHEASSSSWVAKLTASFEFNKNSFYLGDQISFLAIIFWNHVCLKSRSNE